MAGLSSTGTEIDDTMGLPTTHPSLWQNGTMTDLGSLGGTLATTGSFNDGPWSAVLNQRGEVAGTSTLSGDDIWHAFTGRTVG